MSTERGFTPEQAFYKQPTSEKKTPDAPKGVETKEKERCARYEIKDKKGDVICVAAVEYFDEEEVEHKELFNASARRLKSFVLEKDGKSIDVLDVFCTDKPIKIFVSTTNDEFAYQPAIRSVFSPPPDNAISIAGMFHELGHANQSQFLFFESILKMEKSLASFSGDRVPLYTMGVESLFADLAKTFPELLPKFPPEEVFKTLDAMAELGEEQKKYEHAIWYAEKHFAELAMGREQYNKLATTFIPISVEEFNKRYTRTEKNLAEFQKKLLELKKQTKKYGGEKKMAKMYREMVKPLESLMVLVERVMERDATQRAFKVLRFVHQVIGADLLSPEVDIPEHSKGMFKKPEACSESTTRLATNLQKFGGFSAKGSLLMALGSYDALEKIPLPDSRRLQKMEDERWENE